MRFASGILLAISAAALGLLSLEWFGKAEAIATTWLYGLFMSAPILEGPLAIATSIATPLSVTALSLAFLGAKRSKPAFLMLGGVIGALSILIHPLFFIFLIPALLGNAWISKRRDSGDFARMSGIFLAGVAIPLLAMVAWLTYAGVVDDFVEQVFVRTFFTYTVLNPDVPPGI
jgi:hypothetical protein